MAIEIAPGAVAIERQTPAALAPPLGHPRFPMLDGMRAVGAICVFITHLTVLEGVNSHHWWGRFTPQVGDIGLAILFMTSGFLLYRPWASAFRGGPRAPTPRAFLRNRLLRIIPGYWVALTLAAVYPGLPHGLGPQPWVQYSFLQVYSDRTAFAGLVQTWTLCVEMAFYLWLPLFALWVGRARLPVLREGPVIVGAVVLAIAVNAFVFAVRGHWLIAFQTILGYADDLAIGLALAIASARLELGQRVPAVVLWLARHATVTWTIAICTFGLACTLDHFNGDLAYPPRFTLATWVFRRIVIAATAALMMLPMTLDRQNVRSPIGRLLSWRVAAWMGLVSFGFYLYHLPILWWAQQHAQSRRIAPFALLTFAMSVAAAAASYYWVERPFHALKSR